MNVTTSAFSLTQMILAWTLLALLVGWLIIFAALALRVFFKNAEWEDLPTPSRPHPAIYVQPADSRLQYVRVATGDARPKSTHTGSSRDIGTTSKK